MKHFSYTITDEIGLHARPAGLLVKEAKRFTSKITVSKSGNSAEATKLMAVMKLNIKKEDTVDIIIEGDDEAAAFEAVKTFFESNL